MKEIKEEAKRHHEAKLHKYGVSREERAACGGSMKRAHGGHVHEVDLECKGKTGPEIKRAHGGSAHHPHKKEDLRLIETLEHHHMKHGGRTHRIDGGPVGRLGRGRKGGKGTHVAVNILGKPGGDGPAPMPPALGAGPGPGVPSAPPPRPIIPAAAPAGLPARPGMPVKHGGKVHKHAHGGKAEHHPHKEKDLRLIEELEHDHMKRGGHTKHHGHHSQRHHHSGHRGR